MLIFGCCAAITRVLATVRARAAAAAHDAAGAVAGGAVDPASPVLHREFIEVLVRLAPLRFGGGAGLASVVERLVRDHLLVPQVRAGARVRTCVCVCVRARAPACRCFCCVFACVAHVVASACACAVW